MINRTGIDHEGEAMNHTQGKLHIHKDHPDRVMGVGSNGGGTIFRALLGCCIKLEQEANARRMLACWNACEDQSTENLEADTAQGYSPWAHVAELEAQRDELLEALREMLVSIEDHPCHTTDEGHAESEGGDVAFVSHLGRVARTAIEKVKV